jgi:hypothetical protein
MQDIPGILIFTRVLVRCVLNVEQREDRVFTPLLGALVTAILPISCMC